MILTPGGYKRLVAENLTLRQQLIVASRRHKKSPPMHTIDHIILGLNSFFIPVKRLQRLAIIVKPATILKFHRALVRRKHHVLFGSESGKKLGRKGFDRDMVNLVVKIKEKNSSYGCPRIAMLVTNITGISISEQTVRRILRKHLKHDPGDGPSWLSFIGNQVDSLWSIDLFRCESINLKSYWVMVAIDVHSRRIIGYSIQATAYTGPSVCRMFNDILADARVIPKRINTDNDPLFKYHQWKANLRIAEIEEIKTVPEIPRSNPYVERLIGSTRRECLDQVLFWNEQDLKRKLESYQKYYNEYRVHYSLGGIPPNQFTGKNSPDKIDPKRYSWKQYSSGLYSHPIAA